MYTTQIDLITHLKTADANFPARLKIKTIKEYAGEVADIHKNKLKLPAVLPIMISARPISQAPVMQFDLIVITESRTLNKRKGNNNNLELSSTLCEWLEDNPEFEGDEFYYDIRNREQLQVRTIAITERFAGVAISLEIMKSP